MVRHRGNAFEERRAARVGDVIIRDEEDPCLPPENRARRYFWLLNYGVQIVYSPLGWPGEWRVDVVDFSMDRSMGVEVLTVRDMVLDIVVEDTGPTYRMLDLDQLADRMGAGELSVEAAATALRTAQRFLDAFLHRGAPFPPPQIVPYIARQPTPPSEAGS